MVLLTLYSGKIKISKLSQRLKEISHKSYTTILWSIDFWSKHINFPYGYPISNWGYTLISQFNSYRIELQKYIHHNSFHVETYNDNNDEYQFIIKMTDISWKRIPSTSTGLYITYIKPECCVHDNFQNLDILKIWHHRLSHPRIWMISKLPAIQLVTI